MCRKETAILATDHVDVLIERYPDLNVFLMERGIFCVQCGEVFWGTLGDLIASKGMDVDQVVAEINAQFAI